MEGGVRVLTREEERDIIKRVLSGETQVCETLVLANQRNIYNLCFRMTRNPEDANDLAQDAFLKAYQNLAGFKGDSSFSLWIYRLTSNLCIDFLRKEKRRTKSSLTYLDDAGETQELEIVDERFTPERALEKTEAIEQLQKGLDTLTAEHREILLMREIDGLSYDEIAEVLNISSGTVKSRIARARQNLTKLLLEERNFFEKTSSCETQGEKIGAHNVLGKGE